MTRIPVNKRTHADIKIIVNNMGYYFIGEYTSEKEKRRVIIQDEIGYKYDVTLDGLLTGNIPSPFHVSNPYTLENISLWLKINNSCFKLIENNVYTGAFDKLKLYHTVCNEEFLASWEKIYGGRGCPVCAGQQVGERTSLKYLREDLVQEWHPDNLLSPEEVPIFSDKKTCWICSTCGYGKNKEWIALIKNRVRGQGCPACKMSGGEKRISYYLNKNHINYIFQYSPDNLKSKKNRPLEYDFAIINENNEIIYLIEYDDIQHDKFIKFFHKTEKGFENHKERDSLKNDFAKNNNVFLLRIKAKDYNNIEEILESILNEQ